MRSNDSSEPDGDASRALAAAEASILNSLVTTIVEARVGIAAFQAFETRALAAAAALGAEQMLRVTSLASRDREMPLRSIAAEVATAVRTSDRSVQRQLNEATMLVDNFPATLSAWGEGRISRAHVAVIVEAGHGIEDPDARTAYERDVLVRAFEETPGRLAPVAKILANRAQPRTIDERHGEAREDRCVRVADLADGMGELVAILPSVLARGIFDRLTEQAHAVKNARGAAVAALPGVVSSVADPNSAEPTEAGPNDGVPADAATTDAATTDAATTDAATTDGAAAVPPADERSMDQLRADLFADMLLTGVPAVDDPDAGMALGAIRARVHVTVPLLTLADKGAEPAVLAGSGPIDADTARVLAGGCVGWERVMTHPVVGAVLAVDRYRPGEDLKRLLRVRDEHCRFPGCRMPAHRCDLDHTVDAARGGPTCATNLAHLCPGHHTLKHATPWTVEQRPGGVLEWTSPTGRAYVDTPEPVLRFMSAADPPPF